MKIGKFSFFAIICCLLLGLVWTISAYAQPQPGSVTREVDRKVRQEVQKEMRPTAPTKPPIEEAEEKEEVPKGPKFFCKNIILTGTESFPSEDFEPIIEKYENREVHLGDLNTLAKEIERDYLKKGIISACYVPPQEVRSGVVTLTVVEAKMGELIIKDHKWYDKERLEYYWTIRPGEVLRYNEMARILYEMNKNADRTVKSTLAAGKKPGTTDVILEAETKFPVHVSATYDKEGAVASGRERKGIGLRHNNFLFADDILITGYNYGKEFWGLYGYHSIQLTPFGTWVMYGYSYSRSHPKKEYASSDLDSRSENSSGFVHQDLFMKGKYIGEVYAGMDAKDKTTRIVSGTVTRDRLRILRFGGNFILEGPGRVTYFHTELSQGINGFGARRKSSLSSRGAGNTFFAVEADMNHRLALPLGIQGVVKLAGQVAGERLTPQEEFSLGGLDSVRGYPNGDFLADNAFQSNFEMLFPIAFFLPDSWELPFDGGRIKDTVTGVTFFDYAYGEKRGMRPFEMKGMNLASIGTGLRMRFYDKFTMRLEWGFITGDKSLTESAESRFHISLDLRI
ncbi:ShlB/FhaC/HecB family hemolysin secretion/activation protein [Candidatus Omnitrophota bacterium]